MCIAHVRVVLIRIIMPLFPNTFSQSTERHEDERLGNMSAKREGLLGFGSLLHCWPRANGKNLTRNHSCPSTCVMCYEVLGYIYGVTVHSGRYVTCRVLHL